MIVLFVRAYRINMSVIFVHLKICKNGENVQLFVIFVSQF